MIRWVDENFEVNGLYNLHSTTVDSIVASIKDVLLCFEIPTSKIRGQCYVQWHAGAKGGVAAKIQKIEPKAVFTHCYGHALNLSVNDTIKGSVAMKDCLDTCKKFSPNRQFGSKNNS